MTFLKQVTRGKVKRPYCILVHGTDGVGKTTFGASAPAPIFLGSETGADLLDVDRFPRPKNWADAIAQLKELVSEPHNFKTLAVDTLDWLEMLLHQAICLEAKATSMPLAMGGYGKAYVEAVSRWNIFRLLCEEARVKRGMNLVFLAHTHVVNFTDPQTQSMYNRYELKLESKAAALWREYVDAVLFANWTIFQKKEGNQLKSFGDGARVLHTDRRPGWDAKNRFGMPLKIDFSWQAVVEAIDKGEPESMEAVLGRIEGLLSEVTDDDLRTKVNETVEKHKGDIQALILVANRLAVRVGETA